MYDTSDNFTVNKATWIITGYFGRLNKKKSSYRAAVHRITPLRIRGENLSETIMTSVALSHSPSTSRYKSDFSGVIYRRAGRDVWCTWEQRSDRAELFEKNKYQEISAPAFFSDNTSLPRNSLFLSFIPPPSTTIFFLFPFSLFSSSRRPACS